MAIKARSSKSQIGAFFSNINDIRYEGIADESSGSEGE